MKKKFGGLNTLSGSLALPDDDSPSLLNVDFDISGSVKKRKGTITIFKDSATLNPVFASRFVTLLGQEFIVSKYDLNLRVLDLVDDKSTVIWSKANVFRDVTLLPFSVPLDNNINLLLCEKHAPIQVRFQELRQVVTTAGTSIALDVGVEWVNTYVDTVVYVNGKRVTASLAYSSGVLTLSSVTLSVGDTVYICTFSWQWWAEALIWYGDSFYQRVSRFGASDEDKHVQIPNSIASDEIPDSSNFGIFAFRSDTYGENYVLKTNNQPQISLEYSFSDGSSYTPSVKSFTNPSKFFITFGDITNVNERTFTDKDITGNQIKILKHKLKSFDIISLRNTEGDSPVGTTDGTFYYVKYITDDIIELYTDALLTTIVTLGARNSKSFTDVAVDYGANFIAITAHGFSNGQPVRLTSTGVPPIPTSENSTYYAKSLTVNAVELYFDANLRKKVLFVNRVELFFNSTNVSGDTLLIAQHNLFDSDPVRFRTANGTLPGTINNTSVFYVRVLTAGAIKIYTDAALTTLVPNYTGLTGDVFLYIDGGTHQLVADGLTTTAERVAYDSVSFIRLRQLRFNNDTGVLNSNLNVFVGEQLATRNTTLSASISSPSYYTHTTETLTPYTLTALKQKFVSFTAETPIGVPKDTFITLVNTERKWCGSAALNTKDAFNNGSYVPAFGLGDYADYDAGVFPTFGALYQSRLCLGGVGALVLVSGVYDKLVKDAPYRYFQITDDLSNPTLDPFSMRVPFPQADSVRAMKQWQQYLFIFTRSSTFKTTLDSNNLFSASVPTLTLTANIGCISREGVDTTENTMYFLSDGGVYDMAVVLQNEYRASEVSVPIRNIVHDFTSNAQLCYDAFNNKLYVYDERLLVFFTDVRVWGEYRAVLDWDISSMMAWRDAVVLCCKLLCDFQMIQTEYGYYVDFAKNFTSGQQVLVQPCAQNIPSYTGVTRYTSPLVMSPVLSERDVTILYNGVVTENWTKLNSEEISISGVEDGGQLTFFYNVEGSFNGALLYEDNVVQPLSNVSLGIVPLNNFCTLVDYDDLDVLDGDGNTYDGRVDVSGNPVYGGTPVLDGSGNQVFLGDNPVYSGGSPLQNPSLYRVSPSGTFVLDPTGDPLPREYIPPSEFDCEPIYPDKRCIWTANPNPTAGYGSHGSVVLGSGLELFLHCEISVTPPYDKGCSLLNKWKCNGGVCTQEFDGVYDTQAECEAALIPPPFTGGRCNFAYVYVLQRTGGLGGTAYIGLINATNGTITAPFTNLNDAIAGARGGVNNNVYKPTGITSIVTVPPNVTVTVGFERPLGSPTTQGIPLPSDDGFPTYNPYTYSVQGVYPLNVSDIDNCGNLPSTCP